MISDKLLNTLLKHLMMLSMFFLVASAQSAVTPKVGFKGDVIGESYKTFQDKKGNCCAECYYKNPGIPVPEDKKDINGVITCLKTKKIATRNDLTHGKVPVEENVFFRFYKKMGGDGGLRLFSIHFMFKEEYFDKVKANLVAKFGSPQKSKSVEVENRMGATFDRKVVSWEFDGDRVVLRESTEKLGYAQVDLFDPPTVEAVNEASSEEPTVQY